MPSDHKNNIRIVRIDDGKNDNIILYGFGIQSELSKVCRTGISYTNAYNVRLLTCMHGRIQRLLRDKVGNCLH